MALSSWLAGKPTKTRALVWDDDDVPAHIENGAYLVLNGVVAWWNSYGDHTDVYHADTDSGADPVVLRRSCRLTMPCTTSSCFLGRSLCVRSGSRSECMPFIRVTSVDIVVEGRT